MVTNDWIFKQVPPCVEACKAKIEHEVAMVLNQLYTFLHIVNTANEFGLH